MKFKVSTGGKTYTSQPKNVEKEYKRFGSKVVQAGRKTLNSEGKRASGTLFDDFHYKYFETKNSIDVEFKFGDAESYWRFVDAGVQGAGGFAGSGSARGAGSPFKYTNKQPPLQPLMDWIDSKNLQGRDKKGKFITKRSFAFAVARSIKQKGLPRTLFFTRAVSQYNQTFDKRLKKAWEKDMEVLWNKGLPKTILTVDFGTITLD